MQCKKIVTALLLQGDLTYLNGRRKRLFTRTTPFLYAV